MFWFVPWFWKPIFWLYPMFWFIPWFGLKPLFWFIFIWGFGLYPIFWFIPWLLKILFWFILGIFIPGPWGIPIGPLFIFPPIGIFGGWFIGLLLPIFPCIIFCWGLLNGLLLKGLFCSLFCCSPPWSIWSPER